MVAYASNLGAGGMWQGKATDSYSSLASQLNLLGKLKPVKNLVILQE